MIYNWENGGAIDPSYYGIIAFNGLDGGTSTDSVPLSRLEGYDFLSVLTPPLAMDLDHRTIVGDGPYNLQNGETLVVGFGIVAGNNLTDLQANTDIAQSIWDDVIAEPTSVDYQEAFFPKEISLEQNHPNPFNPSTTIKFTIAKSPHLSRRDSFGRGDGRGGLVTLKVYDVLGAEVAILVNEEKPTGTYEVEFSVGQNSILSLSNGIYFYQLRAGNFVETKKMLMIK